MEVDANDRERTGAKREGDRRGMIVRWGDTALSRSAMYRYAKGSKTMPFRME
jgi:hypothetical protein